MSSITIEVTRGEGFPSVAGKLRRLDNLLVNGVTPNAFGKIKTATARQLAFYLHLIPGHHRYQPAFEGGSFKEAHKQGALEDSATEDSNWSSTRDAISLVVDAPYAGIVESGRPAQHRSEGEPPFVFRGFYPNPRLLREASNSDRKRSYVERPYEPGSLGARVSKAARGFAGNSVQAVMSNTPTSRADTGAGLIPVLRVRGKDVPKRSYTIAVKSPSNVKLVNGRAIVSKSDKWELSKGFTLEADSSKATPTLKFAKFSKLPGMVSRSIRAGIEEGAAMASSRYKPFSFGKIARPAGAFYIGENKNKRMPGTVSPMKKLVSEQNVRWLTARKRAGRRAAGEDKAVDMAIKVDNFNTYGTKKTSIGELRKQRKEAEQLKGNIFSKRQQELFIRSAFRRNDISDAGYQKLTKKYRTIRNFLKNRKNEKAEALNFVITRDLKRIPPYGVFTQTAADMPRIVATVLAQDIADVIKGRAYKG